MDRADKIISQKQINREENKKKPPIKGGLIH